MPLSTLIWLVLIAITASGLTLVAVHALGLPLGATGLVALAAALALRLWLARA